MDNKAAIDIEILLLNDLYDAQVIDEKVYSIALEKLKRKASKYDTIDISDNTSDKLCATS